MKKRIERFETMYQKREEQAEDEEEETEETLSSETLRHEKDRAAAQRVRQRDLGPLIINPSFL